MRRRWLWAILLAFSVQGLSRCSVWAQTDAPPECEPLTPASVARVADRLGLDADQSAWLLQRFTQGELRGPDDVRELPGAGTAILDALEAAWCWEPGAALQAGTVLGAVRSRAVGQTREARVAAVGPRVEFQVRARRTPSTDAVVRGGGRVRAGSWSLTGGQIRSREGLGLLWATPGALPREGGVLRPAVGGWEETVTTEPQVLSGFALRRVGGVDAELAAVRSNGTAWVSAAVRHQGWALLGVQGPSGPGTGIAWRGASAGGLWGLEGAWSGAGGALGASGEIAEGDWRLRASLVGIGTGFQAPLRAVEPQPDAQVAWAAEVTWRPAPGRFVRASWEASRDPRVGTEDWPRDQRQLSLEWGERLRPGLVVSALWRGKTRYLAAAPPDPEEVQHVLRGELTLARSRWRGLLRVEERSHDLGWVRNWSARWGRGGQVSWEFRVTAVTSSAISPVVWGYARRAGGTYGWDRLDPGTWWGAWLRWEHAVWSLETSGDLRAAGWDVGLALRLRPWSGA